LLNGFKCADPIVVLHEDVYLALVESRQVESLIYELLYSVCQGSGVVSTAAGHFQPVQCSCAWPFQKPLWESPSLNIDVDGVPKGC
jgi:hypothetical protein